MQGDNSECAEIGRAWVEHVVFVKATIWWVETYWEETTILNAGESSIFSSLIETIPYFQACLSLLVRELYLLVKCRNVANCHCRIHRERRLHVSF